MAQPPVPNLRGDYAAADAEFVLPPGHLRHSEADQATWRTLYARQAALLEGHAAEAFRDGLARLDCADAIPDLAATSRTLGGITGWTLVPVPGLIPDDAFFAHLAGRRFPVTTWMRRPEELDYIVEPDLFHDFFGHVPMLTEPDFAGFLEAYGRLGEAAAAAGAIRPLARLYWHMVEFGLLRESGGHIRAYGAGILSSRAETLEATEGTAPRRLWFDLARVLRTDYEIDRMQPTYFVIERFRDLFEAMEGLEAALADARDAPALAPGDTADGDIPVPLLHPSP